MRNLSRLLCVFGFLVSVAFAESLDETRKKAEKGDAIAQTNLGLIYTNGDSVPKDSSEAAKWYRKAADQGEADAQSALAYKYIMGDGVPKDSAEAVKWYRKAADQGNADARYNLGIMYANGVGVPKDSAEAVKWYHKAADQGNADAQFNLAVMYANGDGVPKSSAEAVKWYRKAADQGKASAQSNLGKMYGDGDGVPKDSAEAMKWYRKAADQGTAIAQSNIGLMYANGDGVPKDLVQAHVWWNIAGAKGHENAKKYLANIEGQMTDSQKEKAMVLARELFVVDSLKKIGNTHVNATNPLKNSLEFNLPKTLGVIIVLLSAAVVFIGIIKIYAHARRALSSSSGNISVAGTSETKRQDIAQVGSGELIDANYLKKYVHHVAKKLQLADKFIPPVVFTTEKIFITKENLKDYGDLLHWTDLENMKGQARGVYCCWLTAGGGIQKHYIKIHLEAGLHEVDYISVIAHEMRHCWQRVNGKCLDKPEHDAIGYQDWYMETGRFE